MNELIRKTGIIFTAFLLIAATGGYSVYQHFCNCEGDVITSVFMELQCESHGQDEADQSCCSSTHAERSCCSDTPEKSCSDHHSGDCCHTYSQFLKINDSFNAGQVNTSIKVFTNATVLFEKEALLKEEASQPAIPYISDSSPPLSGRQILLEIHQLKLAPELA